MILMTETFESDVKLLTSAVFIGFVDFHGRSMC